MKIKYVEFSGQRLACVLLAGWMMTFGNSWAVSTKKVEVDSAADFEQGEPISLAIAEPGELRPGISSQMLSELKKKQLWNSAWNAKEKEIIVGSGPEGEVFALSARGNSRLLAKLPETEVYAVAVSPSGVVFAGSSPDGKVYRLQKDGKFEVYFEPKEEYIWDLAFDDAGVLYVATGSKGKIYRVSAKEKGEVFLDTDETHIRCLAFDAKKRLLAGTSDGGLLYRIERKNKAVVLLDTEKPEVRAIAVDSEGVIYAAVNKQSSLEGMPPVFKKSAPSGGGSGTGESESKADEEGGESSEEGSSSSGKNSSVKKQTGSGSLFRLSDNLYPKLVGEIPYMIHSLTMRQEDLLLGTASGYLFSIDKKQQWSQLGKVEAEQVTGLLPVGKDRIFALTSNLGRLFSVQMDPQGVGRYLSKVIDTKLYARWGKLHVEGKGSWTIRTRSGNTARPDKSWYEWQEIKAEQITSPQARYLQFQVELQRGSLDRVILFYLPQNQPPRIEKIVVLDAGTFYAPIFPPPQPSPQTLGLEQLLSGHANPSSENKPQFQLTKESERRAVVWQASDPNSDDLEFKAEIRPLEDPKWRLLREKLKEPLVMWDTGGWSEGKYYVRITANDGLSNTKEEALHESKESAMILIDRTPPQIRILHQSDKRIRIRVIDSVSLLGEVSASLNGEEQKPLTSADGILDSSSEEFELERKANQAVTLRAYDEVGNTAGLYIPAYQP